MKKTLQIILVFAMSLGIFLIPSELVKADKSAERALSNNKVKLWVDDAGIFKPPFWASFGFVDMGDGSVRLRADHSYHDNIFLGHPYTVKFYDNEGSIYYSKSFSSGYRVRDFASEIGNVRLRYGLDSIQITWGANVKLLALDGYIYGNLDNIDYTQGISKTLASDYSFRVTKEGLYAEYRHQVRIPDGEYVIETAENSNKVFDILNGFDIYGVNFDSSKTNQKFKLKYDHKHKAYKILTSDNNVLSRQNRTSNNVIMYPDNNYGDQFWYLQDMGNGRHRIVSARNIYQSMDLNRSNNNIEVHDSHNGLNQQFKFVKPADKEASIIKGDWKVSSKLDHNKVLNAYHTGSQNGDVVMWNNSGVHNQMWTFNYDSTRGAYAIINKLTGKALAWDSTTSRNVFTWDYNSNYDDQHWILEDVGSGHYLIKNYKNQNLVLDVPMSDPSNGVSVIVSERHGDNNQKFKLIK